MKNESISNYPRQVTVRSNSHQGLLNEEFYSSFHTCLIPAEIKIVTNCFFVAEGLRYSVAWKFNNSLGGEQIFKTLEEAESFKKGLRGEKIGSSSIT